MSPRCARCRVRRRDHPGPEEFSLVAYAMAKRAASQEAFVAAYARVMRGFCPGYLPRWRAIFRGRSAR